MTIPYRGATGHGTYFITSATYQRKSIFQSDVMADLLAQVLCHYRNHEKYLLHEFVIMPDHIHLLITPTATLEQSLQFIKGGYSYRAKKELGFGGEIWETSFHDRRVRDWNEFERFRQYIHQNPVKKGLASAPGNYPYCSASGSFACDALPQRLKPADLTCL